MKEDYFLGHRRLIIQYASEEMAPLLRLSRPRHEQYALRWDYDYQVVLGRGVPYLPGSWQKIPLLRQALQMGYGEVAWLDADALIMDASADIFPLWDKDLSIAMAELGPDWSSPFNAGVIFLRNTSTANAMLEWVWLNRNRRVDGYVEIRYEEDQINEWLKNNPDSVQHLGLRQHYATLFSPPCDNPIIKGYHREEDRFRLMKADLDESN